MKILFTISPCVPKKRHRFGFDEHRTILMAEMLLRKWAVKRYFISLPYLTAASALPGETESQKLRLFTWTLNVGSPTNTQNIHIIIWSQLNHPSLAQASTVCIKQNIGH